MNESIRKFYPDKHDDNIIVEVSFMLSAELADDCNIYKCVGVLTKETDEMIRVAFSSENEKIIDYFDIKTENILEIKLLNDKDIEKVG